MKPLKILYFVNGPAPSLEQFQEASAMNGNVCFRNAKHIPAEPHGLEECDGVAGEVPTLYSDRFPDANEVITKRLEHTEDMSKRLGDNKAPRKGAQKKGTGSDVDTGTGPENSQANVSDASRKRDEQTKPAPDPVIPAPPTDGSAPTAPAGDGAATWKPQGGANS